MAVAADGVSVPRRRLLVCHPLWGRSDAAAFLPHLYAPAALSWGGSLPLFWGAEISAAFIRPEKHK